VYRDSSLDGRERAGVSSYVILFYLTGAVQCSAAQPSGAVGRSEGLWHGLLGPGAGPAGQRDWARGGGGRSHTNYNMSSINRNRPRSMKYD